MNRVLIAKELIRIATQLVRVAGRFNVGDKVQFKGKRRVYEVTRIDQFGNYDLQATTGGPRGSRPTSVDENSLQPAGVKEVSLDKQGRTAVEAAMQDYPKGTKVILDMNRLTREQLGVVEGISKSGQITVQTYVGGDWRGQEQYVPNQKTKGDKVSLKPELYRGDFIWSSKRDHLYLKKRYTGGTLDSLLD